MPRCLLVVMLVLAGLSTARAQSADSLVTAMQTAYEGLDYAAAETAARAALATYDQLRPDQLVVVHTTLGLILHARNEPVEARQHLRAALALDPALTLDPLLVSPKTVAFFDEVRADLVQVDRPPETTAEVRYIVLRDERPAAALRSLAVPGWGQLHKGDRARGWALVGLWGAGLATTATAHLRQADARTAYEDETDPARVEDRYRTYNTWYRTRNVAALATGLVWAYGLVDALATGGPQAPSTLAVTAAPGHVGLRVRF